MSRVDVVLVRHADAGDKRAWCGPDAARPLSPLGSLQATTSVAPFLVGLGVTRLLSSPARRCLQTLEPAGTALGLTVEPVDELAVTGSGARIAELLARPDLRGAALCTHGESLAAVSTAWVAGGVEVLGPDGSRVTLAGTPKGAAWVIRSAGRGRLRAHLVATHELPTRPQLVS